MKKIIGLFLIATVLTLTANAQNSDVKFSAGGGFVSGNFGGETMNGFGFDLIAKKDISETLEGFAQIGYNTFSKSYVPYEYTANELSLNAKINVIPVLVGVNYKAGNFRPGIGIGYSSATAKFDVSGSLSGGTDLDVIGDATSTGGLTISPQLGYNFNKVDIVAQYLSISASGGNASGFGLKVFYNF